MENRIEQLVFVAECCENVTEIHQNFFIVIYSIYFAPVPDFAICA